jgi:hypothetical protein
MGGLFYHRVSKDSILLEFAEELPGVEHIPGPLYRPIGTDKAGDEN